MPTDGAIEAAVTVKNTGKRAGDEVVLLFAHDKVGSVTRPLAQLIGYHRVSLEPGESARVTFSVPTTRLAFSDRSYRRIVEPGDVDLWTGTARDRFAEGATVLTGEVHPVDVDSPRWATASSKPVKK